MNKNHSLEWLPVASIKPNPQQPRIDFNEKRLAELANSIRRDGVLQPIEVEVNGDNSYLLHHGERRLRAVKLLGLEKIPAIIAPALGQEELFIRAAVENIQREDMDVIEEGRVYQTLHNKGWSWAKIGRRFGKAQPTIRNRVGWLTMDPAIQALVANGEIPRDTRILEALKSLPDEKQAKMAKRMKGQGIRPILKSVATYLTLAANQNGNGRYRPPSKENVRKARKERVPSLAMSIGEEIVPGETGTIVQEAMTKVCKSCPLYEFPTGPACDECPATNFIRIYTKAVANE